MESPSGGLWGWVEPRWRTWRVWVWAGLIASGFLSGTLAISRYSMFGLPFGTDIVALGASIARDSVLTAWGVASLFVWVMVHSEAYVREGRCDHCGYDTAGLADAVCPECGKAHKPRARIRVRWKPAVLGWLLACVIAPVYAEAWRVADETSFRREAMLRMPSPTAKVARAALGWPSFAYERPRWFPSWRSTLYCYDGEYSTSRTRRFFGVP